MAYFSGRGGGFWAVFVSYLEMLLFYCMLCTATTLLVLEFHDALTPRENQLLSETLQVIFSPEEERRHELLIKDQIVAAGSNCNLRLTRDVVLLQLSEKIRFTRQTTNDSRRTTVHK